MKQKNCDQNGGRIYHIKYKLREGIKLSIWEMADLEYMKYTFIDAEQVNNRDDHCDSHTKPDLFDYIDSIGKIEYVDDEYQEFLKKQKEKEHCLEDEHITISSSSSMFGEDDDDDGQGCHAAGTQDQFNLNPNNI